MFLSFAIRGSLDLGQLPPVAELRAIPLAHDEVRVSEPDGNQAPSVSARLVEDTRLHQSSSNVVGGPSLHQSSSNVVGGSSLHHPSSNLVGGPSLHQSLSYLVGGSSLHQSPSDLVGGPSLHQSPSYLVGGSSLHQPSDMVGGSSLYQCASNAVGNSWSGGAQPHRSTASDGATVRNACATNFFLGGIRQGRYFHRRGASASPSQTS